MALSDPIFTCDGCGCQAKGTILESGTWTVPVGWWRRPELAVHSRGDRRVIGQVVACSIDCLERIDAGARAHNLSVPPVRRDAVEERPEPKPSPVLFPRYVYGEAVRQA